MPDTKRDPPTITATDTTAEAGRVTTSYSPGRSVHSGQCRPDTGRCHSVRFRGRPKDTWTAVGVDPYQVAQAIVDCWRDGEVTGLQVDDLGFEEARSLTRRR